MTINDVIKLKPGLYEITWENQKQTSLAAIGRTSLGQPWLAPCIFTEWELPMVHPILWGNVKSAKLIAKQKTREKRVIQ